MYQASEPLSIEEFMQATSFLPPKGHEAIEYFIVPIQSGFELPEGTGFELENGIDPKADPSTIAPSQVIVYSKKKPIEKISQERSKPEYVEKPKPLTRTPPIRQQVMPSTDTLSLGSPFVRKVSESTPKYKILESMTNGHTIILEEDFMCFPKNTIFKLL
jgi:hypothetical protein